MLVSDLGEWENGDSTKRDQKQREKDEEGVNWYGKGQPGKSTSIVKLRYESICS